MISTFVDRVAEGSPQLFRELRGRLKPRNIVIASVVSLVGQLLTYLYFQSKLPFELDTYIAPVDRFSRYCLGNPPPGWNGYAPYPYTNDNYCVKDLVGHWMLNWQLWWLDIFVTLSIISIFTLLAAGTYMLIADLSREERRGTLNFIRLSPQSAKSVLIGKMLGVPVMLYLAIALTLPLQLIAGLSARIPLMLILAFYGILALSCALFYSASLLFGLVSTGLGGFQAWLGSGIVLFFLSFLTGLAMSGNLQSRTSFDLMSLLYPGTVLPYLVNATFLPPKTVGYLNFGESYSSGYHLADLMWYGQPLWRNAWNGFAFMALNFCWWIFWLGQGLKRRFHNPLTTLWSKGQSYIISGSFAALLLGFTLQTTNSYDLYNSFYLLQGFVLMFFLILISALSPHRQMLQDWARYRHQVPQERRNFLKELIWGEKSPSTVAIAINLAIVTAFIVPSIVLFPLKEHKMQVLAGVLLNVNMILVYAAIAQLLLFMKNQKRTVWAGTTVTAMMLFPLGIMALFGNGEPAKTAIFGLFSVASVWAVEYVSTTAICLSILGQWLAIVAVSFQMSKQLQKAGESETQALLSGRHSKAIASS